MARTARDAETFHDSHCSLLLPPPPPTHLLNSTYNALTFPTKRVRRTASFSSLSIERRNPRDPKARRRSAFPWRAGHWLASLALLLAFGAFMSPTAYAQTVSLPFNNAPVGTPITATLTGFSAKVSVRVWLYTDSLLAPGYDARTCRSLSLSSPKIVNGRISYGLGPGGAVTTNSDGAATIRFTVDDRFDAGNNNYICAVYASEYSNVVRFNVDDSKRVALSRSSGGSKSKLTVTLSGFDRNSSVFLWLYGNPDTDADVTSCSSLSSTGVPMDERRPRLAVVRPNANRVVTVSNIVVDGRFYHGSKNYICAQQGSNHSNVVSFTVNHSPNINLSAPLIAFDHRFTAQGNYFSGDEKVTLHLLSNPSSTPATCDAVRSAGGVELGSTAGPTGYNPASPYGRPVISNVRVTKARFSKGDNNYLCLYGETSGTSSPVVQLTALEPFSFVPSPENLEIPQGTSRTFTLRLASAPDQATTWLLETGDPATAEINRADAFNPTPGNGAHLDLTFTPANWNNPQTFTVTGMSAGTTKLVAVYAGGDRAWRNVALNIPVTVTSSNGFTLSRSALRLKAGESRSFTVRLKDQPPAGTHGVWTLTSDLDVTIEPAVLGFTRSNWDKPRPVVLTGKSGGTGTLTTEWVGRDGAELSFAEPLALRLTVVAGKFLDVSLWNGADRDGFLQLQEGGQGGGFSVALSQRPTGTVTVSATATSETGVANPDLHPRVLIFTRANWAKRRTIALAARPDANTTDESVHVHLDAEGGGYTRVSAEVGACVDDAGDADQTCTYAFEPEGSPGKRPIESPDDPGGGDPDCPTGQVCINPQGPAAGRTPPVKAQDTTPPRLIAWKRHAPASATTDADVLTWRLTFTEPVTGVTASHFTVRVNGSSKHAATQTVRGSGTRWDVTVAGGPLADLNGTVELAFRTKRGITDLAGTPFTNGTPLDGAPETTYALKNTVPQRFAKGDAALSRLSRSIGLGAIGVVTGRAGATGGSSLTLAGRTIPLGGAGALAALDTGTPGNPGATAGGGLLPGHLAGNVHLQDAGPGRNALTGAGQGTGTMTDLLRGLRFEFASADGATRVWGQGDAPMGGGMTNRFLGMERRFGGGLLAGAALSFSESAGNFGLEASEAMASRLSSAYQYLRFTPGQATEVWSLVGAGKGTAAFTDTEGAVTTELSMEMLAFGSRHAFREATVWGWVPAVSADGFMVRLSTPHTGGLRALGGQASRLRAGVTLARPSEGDGWTPQVGLGLRHEDDERGTVTRTEVRAGLGWVYQRLTVDGMAHLWPSAKREAANAATAGLAQAPESWGARLTARWAAPGNLGFTASLDALTGLVPDAPVWENETVATQASDLRFGLRAGYGLAVGGARWTPAGEVRVADGAYTLRESLRYERGTLRLDLHGEHQRRLALGTGHGVRLDLNVQF